MMNFEITLLSISFVRKGIPCGLGQVIFLLHWRKQYLLNLNYWKTFVSFSQDSQIFDQNQISSVVMFLILFNFAFCDEVYHPCPRGQQRYEVDTQLQQDSLF